MAILSSKSPSLSHMLGKAVGNAATYYNKAVEWLPSDVSTGPANKLWRASILLHRATHGPSDRSTLSNIKLPIVGNIDKFEGLDGQSKHSINDDPAKRNGDLLSKKAARKKARVTVRYIGSQDIRATKLHEIKAHYMQKNQVIIFNLTSVPYQYLVIQNRPTSVEFKGETTWASIKSMGRNSPMYHYTGAEDTLQFNISWYCNDPEHPDEVINKCRLLETWSKANGFKAAPPILKIKWGDGIGENNETLFEDHLYILISATYSMGDFKSYASKGTGSDKLFINKGLFPATATQELIFKRVSSSNLEYSDIISNGKLAYTKGIGSLSK